MHVPRRRSIFLPKLLLPLLPLILGAVWCPDAVAVGPPEGPHVAQPPHPGGGGGWAGMLEAGAWCCCCISCCCWWWWLLLPTARADPPPPLPPVVPPWSTIGSPAAAEGPLIVAAEQLGMEPSCSLATLAELISLNGNSWSLLLRFSWLLLPALHCSSSSS